MIVLRVAVVTKFYPGVYPQTVLRSAEVTLYRSWLRTHCPGFCLAFYSYCSVCSFFFFLSSNVERAKPFLAASPPPRVALSLHTRKCNCAHQTAPPLNQILLDSSLNAYFADIVFSYAIFLVCTNCILIHHISPDTLHGMLLCVCTHMSDAF